MIKAFPGGKPYSHRKEPTAPHVFPDNDLPHGADVYKRQVLVSGRIKSTDEKILYTVDALHSAITAGQQVQFKYCDWNLQKRMRCV